MNGEKKAPGISGFGGFVNEIEFSSLMIPIDSKVKGLLRFSIEPNIKLLELKVEIHKLMIDLNDASLVNTVMKGIIERCDQNPLNNDSIFGTINSKIMSTFRYNYYQLEDLSMKFKFIDEYSNLNEEINFPVDIFKCKMKLFVRDIKRMQRFIDSFLLNYSIILDTLRFAASRKSSSPAAENGESYFEEPMKLPAEQEDQAEKNEERSMIDEILEFLIVSPALLSYLVHLILNYYRFYKLSQISSESGKIKIDFDSIVPASFFINKPYLFGLLKSIENVSIDKINLHTKNLSKFIYNYKDSIGDIELCCCNFILFFFSIRHLMETHKNWLEKNIDGIFSRPDIQIKLLNKYIPTISGVPVEYGMCEKEEFFSTAAKIKRISEKYEYMRIIDQEKFAEFVFDDLKKTSNSKSEIKIGLKNILDLKSLLKNSEKVNEFIERRDKNDLMTILSYHANPDDDKIITDAFKLFLKYVENPVILVTERKTASHVPNNVLNCFEKLKSLLNDNNFKKENISTQYYYEKLAEVLPQDFQFSNALYIVYQIIIPYMYYFHDVSLFEDVFLTTCKFE